MKKQGHAHAARTEKSTAMLNELDAIEDFARERGLAQEADELHAISEKLRAAVGSGETHAISIEDARRVLEELRLERESGGPRQDIQRALA